MISGVREKKHQYETAVQPAVNLVDDLEMRDEHGGRTSARHAS